MRNWLFHPLLFYPLAAIFAAFVIVVSLQPQSWPRDPAPVTAEREEGWLVYQGEGFNSPTIDAAQEITVVRDFWGRAERLRIAQKAQQGRPTPQDQGTRILLSPQDAAELAGHPLTVEVSYNPLPVNAANGLAVSASGAGETNWIQQNAPPQPATLRFRLPAQNEVSSIALRAVSTVNDQAYGLEITRIRITPQT